MQEGVGSVECLWMCFLLASFSFFYLMSELVEAVSCGERQEECTSTCVCVCVCPRIEGEAGFLVRSYCSGECNTDP